jgi:hypothetical protein
MGENNMSEDSLPKIAFEARDASTRIGLVPLLLAAIENKEVRIIENVESVLSDSVKDNSPDRPKVNKAFWEKRYEVGHRYHLGKNWVVYAIQADGGYYMASEAAVMEYVDFMPSTTVKIS